MARACGISQYRTVIEPIVIAERRQPRQLDPFLLQLLVQLDVDSVVISTRCEGEPYTTRGRNEQLQQRWKVITKDVSVVTRYSWCTATTTYGPWTKSSSSCSSSYTYDTYKCVGTPYTYTWTEQSRYTTGGKVVGVNYKTVSYCDPTYSWCSMTSTYGAERPSSYTCAEMFGERNYSKQYNSRNGYYYTCRQEGTKTEYYTVKEWKPVSYCTYYYSDCNRYDDGYTPWANRNLYVLIQPTTSRCLAKTTTVNVPVYAWWIPHVRVHIANGYTTCITNVGYTAWRIPVRARPHTRARLKSVSTVPRPTMSMNTRGRKIRVRVPLRKSRPKSASCGLMADTPHGRVLGCVPLNTQDHRAVKTIRTQYRFQFTIGSNVPEHARCAAGQEGV